VNNSLECWSDRLLGLQHGDSFFPGGAIALSAGLETLVNDGEVRNADQVEVFLTGQLHGRWSTFDRPVLVAAHRSGEDLDRLAGIDLQVEAQTMAAELRKGSLLAGRALLGVHGKLGTPNARQYQNMVRQSGTPGHNTVVQGLVWRGTGISEPMAEAMSAHTFCLGIIGAALRLGIVGHTDGQAMLSRNLPGIAELLSAPCMGLNEVSTFSPHQEIAVMRHETMSYRLFIN
jgi:urease accessory protein